MPTTFIPKESSKQAKSSIRHSESLKSGKKTPENTLVETLQQRVRRIGQQRVGVFLLSWPRIAIEFCTCSYPHGHG